MTKQRGTCIVHFLDVDTRDPLCGGTGHEPSRAAVNGVAICAVCARRMTEQAEAVRELPLSQPPGAW